MFLNKFFIEKLLYKKLLYYEFWVKYISFKLNIIQRNDHKIDEIL